MSRNSNSTALVSHLVTQEFMLMYPITHFAPSISTHSFRKQIARCECTRLQFGGVVMLPSCLHYQCFSTVPIATAWQTWKFQKIARVERQQRYPSTLQPQTTSADFIPGTGHWPFQGHITSFFSASTKPPHFRIIMCPSYNV